MNESIKIISNFRIYCNNYADICLVVIGASNSKQIWYRVERNLVIILFSVRYKHKKVV